MSFETDRLIMNQIIDSILLTSKPNFKATDVKGDAWFDSEYHAEWKASLEDKYGKMV